MKNILFPTDFSEHSNGALNAAIDIAKRTNAKIYVMNAFYAPILDFTSSPGMTQQLYDEEKTEAEKELEKICGKISSEKNQSGNYVPTEYLTELNTPVREILKAVEEKNIDLVVMGAEPKNSFLDFMISTSWEVIKEVKCNVLIVKNDTEFKPLKNIYLAIENIKTEIYNISNVIELARIFNSQIIVAHINPFATSIGDLRSTNESNQDASFFINAIKEYVNYDRINYYPVFCDKVSEGIESSLKRSSCDLLVLVKQERRWWNELFHESVTKELLAKTNTPLLIIH